MSVVKRKHILVAPLDWGLGHATRCIPIIKLLIEKGCNVSIATSGDAGRLLQKEFPNLQCYVLPSYGAAYSRHIPFMLCMLLQLPKFLFAIYLEKKKTRRLVEQNEIDVIISDNRYGCRVFNVQSVFVCHQINLIMPRWLTWLAPVINNFNHRMISKFDQCWVPDDPNSTLSGKLSFPIGPKSTYIGLLSRFSKPEMVQLTYQLAVILSGPEPQRTILEDLVRQQLQQVSVKTIVVRGVLKDNQQSTMGNITVVNYLKAGSLEKIMAASEIILCRPGYSSLMDLAILEKKAILVPTQGQTEQEYLGNRLAKQKVAVCQKQKSFDLQKALTEIKDYRGFAGWASPVNLLEQAIKGILK